MTRPTQRGLRGESGTTPPEVQLTRRGRPGTSGSGGTASPAIDADQVVGVATWLWDARQPLSVTASIPGTTAELVATPMSVSFDMGDGRAPLVMGSGPGAACQAPGVAYDTTLPSAAQHSDCTYTYDARRRARRARSTPSPPPCRGTSNGLPTTVRRGRCPPSPAPPPSPCGWRRPTCW